MFVSETRVRIHYALTDQMGVVYHGNYAQFYEIGRTEAIRQLGYTYKDLEKSGIIMPVVELKSRFLKPAKYDDFITIVTMLKEKPHGHKVTFHHEIYNEQKELLNVGEITLYYLDAKTLRKTHPPELLVDMFKQYFPDGN